MGEKNTEEPKNKINNNVILICLTIIICLSIIFIIFSNQQREERERAERERESDRIMENITEMRKDQEETNRLWQKYQKAYRDAQY